MVHTKKEKRKLFFFFFLIEGTYGIKDVGDMEIYYTQICYTQNIFHWRKKVQDMSKKWKS